MSNHSISIVPKKSNYHDNVGKAKEILEWLITMDIVKSEVSDCVLSFYKGYPVSNGAKNVVDESDNLPFFLVTNGVEITTNRKVFDTGENGMEKCICPHCKQDISQEEWFFINNWYSEISDNSICPLCNVVFNIHDLKIEPEWGFSNLGFTFWNWPDLKNAFIKEFEKKLNCEVSVVYQHM